MNCNEYVDMPETYVIILTIFIVFLFYGNCRRWGSSLEPLDTRLVL